MEKNGGGGVTNNWSKRGRTPPTPPRGLLPNMPSSTPPPGNVTWTVCACVSMCVCVLVLKRAYEEVGELLAVLIFVVHSTFEPQAGEVLEDKVVVLGDAAEDEKERKKIKPTSKTFFFFCWHHLDCRQCLINLKTQLLKIVGLLSDGGLTKAEL